MHGSERCAVPLAGGQARREVGDTWDYQDRGTGTGEKREISFLVTAVDADKIVTETGSRTSGAWTFTRDWNLVERKTGETVANSIKPYWPSLQFPLEAQNV